ncbi:MAG: hypothetical protein ABI662_06780 [Dermatophilaceae bacterium]
MRLSVPIFKGHKHAIIGLAVALAVVVGGVGAWKVNRSSSSEAATPNAGQRDHQHHAPERLGDRHHPTCQQG